VLYWTHLHSDTLGIYSWSEIQLILNMGGGVERISQQTPTNPQTNPQTVVCNINEALSLTPPFNAYITKSYKLQNHKRLQHFNFVWHGLHQCLYPL
jgi:hypothetical protein